MADATENKVYKATLHGWFYRNDVEHQILRREDGKWFVQDIKGGDPEFMAVKDVAMMLAEIHQDGTMSSGWLSKVPGGEDFDRYYERMILRQIRN